MYITGKNGNGKTNLVEALYLLSGSRSFRTNSQSELVQWGKKESSVFGTVVRQTGTTELGVALTPGQRTAFKNGEQLGSVAELVGECSVVAFSPADLSLVKGAPAGRRKFLDRHMVDLQPSFLPVLMAYQRALESKSALLKGQGVCTDQLEPWNMLLVEYGGKIVDKRANFIKELKESANSFHKQFAQTDGSLELSLESDFLDEGEAEVSRERVFAELLSVASREIALRSCVFGPHRDDLGITLAGIDSRPFASQGQTRSIVLALKLGVIELLEGRLKESPIVVLDDVDSELDRERSKRLFAALAKRDRQVFITGTGTPPPELIQTGTQRVQQVEIRGGNIL